MVLRTYHLMFCWNFDGNTVGYHFKHRSCVYLCILYYDCGEPHTGQVSEWYVTSDMSAQTVNSKMQAPCIWECHVKRCFNVTCI